MAKVIDLGSVPPDDPMFSGGPSVFSSQRFKPSSPTLASATDGAASASLSSLPPQPVRETFESQSEFEEALGYWQTHVGTPRPGS